MTGTSLTSALRSSFASGSTHGRSSLTLIGPPIIAMPQVSSSVGGTDSPASSATIRHGIRWRSRKVAKYAGPSVGENRNIVTGLIVAFYCSSRFHLMLPSRLLSCIAVACVLLALSGPPTHAQGEFIQPTPNLHAEGIPPIPASLVKKIGLYTEFRPKGFIHWHPQKRAMLVGTRATNSTQIHVLSTPGAKLEQLTDFPDTVRSARYEPKAGEFLVFAKDVGGSEQTQLHRLDLATKSSTQLTDPDLRHNGGEWNHAGDRIAMSSTPLDK